MILTEIRKALLGLGGAVYYGTAAQHPKGSKWDYTVFSRKTFKSSRDLTSGCDTYEVAVVREGYVPEGALEEVVAAMSAIPGMSLMTSEDVQFAYDRKPGTAMTVEMMIVPFKRTRKATR